MFVKYKINNFDTKKLFYLYEKVIADIWGLGYLTSQLLYEVKFSWK